MRNVWSPGWVLALGLSLVSPAFAQNAAPGSDAIDDYADYLATKPKTYTLKVCNRSSHAVHVAVAFVPTGTSRFKYKGWIPIARDDCKYLLDTNRGDFFAYAEASDSSGIKWEGSGDDGFMCVFYPGPFEYADKDGHGCEKYPAVVRFQPNSYGVFEWSLDS